MASWQPMASVPAVSLSLISTFDSPNLSLAQISVLSENLGTLVRTVTIVSNMVEITGLASGGGFGLLAFRETLLLDHAALMKAAGPELRAACYNVPEARPGIRCRTGEARITPGFRFPASHVIHTVGTPVYDADGNPEASLRSAYRYPFGEAATVAISTVSEFADDFKEVHFVLFSDDI
ncbi:appr-1-p processing enzyme family protein [Actinidia rufa]|uniref:Appr-1-p processing enzyme family protein n=1 Tax=Actinidia rufa TaxID=165716 RepID=A0A7J0EDD1_9ERIC|nr:appr-1-p processing enzyme family protein [Actinidia rufa]